MKLAIIEALAAFALFAVLFSATAFADCSDCQITGVSYEMTYEGSGQYCEKTTMPAGGAYYTDSVGINAEHYEGYQFGTTDGASATTYDYVNVTEGTAVSEQKSYYYNPENNMSTLNVFTTCITEDGKLGAMVYVSGNSGYGMQSAASEGFACIEFSQLNYLNGEFDSGLETGTAAMEGGQVIGMTYFSGNDIWGISTADSNDSLMWLKTDTTKSVDLCAEFETDYITDIQELSNTGAASFFTEIETTENATLDYDAYLNPRVPETTTTLED